MDLYRSPSKRAMIVNTKALNNKILRTFDISISLALYRRERGVDLDIEEVNCCRSVTYQQCEQMTLVDSPVFKEVIDPTALSLALIYRFAKPHGIAHLAEAGSVR